MPMKKARLVLIAGATIAASAFCMEEPPKTIIESDSTQITAETYVKVTSLLRAFMQGTIEANQDGTVLYRKYSDSSTAYKYSLQHAAKQLKELYNAIIHIESGWQQFPEEKLGAEYNSKSEEIKAHSELREFYRFMENEDIFNVTNAIRQTIIENRDTLKKAFKAAEESTAVSDVARQINEARKKTLRPPAPIIK